MDVSDEVVDGLIVLQQADWGFRFGSVINESLSAWSANGQILELVYTSLWRRHDHVHLALIPNDIHDVRSTPADVIETFILFSGLSVPSSEIWNQAVESIQVTITRIRNGIHSTGFSPG